jgi:GntR family transcriptional repressor for pyruvate dehydrogenase complex
MTDKPIFGPVERSRRLSDIVAETMSVRILNDDALAPGTILPSERELAQQFEVSRTVIREAVLSLAAKGIVDVKSGSGARVALLDGTAASEALAIYIRGGGHAYEKVHEVRMTIETEMAGLAAERRTSAHLTAMRSRYSDFISLVGHDVDAATQADVDFHDTIALATGNEVFIVILGSIRDALLDVRRRNIGGGMADEIVEQHGEIMAAIERGDRAEAVSAMRAHLTSVANFRVHVDDNADPS